MIDIDCICGFKRGTIDVADQLQEFGCLGLVSDRKSNRLGLAIRCANRDFNRIVYDRKLNGFVAI